MTTPVQHSPIALVLAAGYARRFGEDKRWVMLHSGMTMIEQVLAHITAAHLPACVVLRSDDPYQASRDWSVPTLVIPAEAAARGLGASIAAAARRLPEEQAVLVCLADMPFIQPATYRHIADALHNDVIAVPVRHGQRGHPVGFSPAYLAELRQLDGDHGARELLARHRSHVCEIAVDDAGIHRDVDTIADLLIGL